MEEVNGETSLLYFYLKADKEALNVVACTCNPATLKTEFRSGASTIPVGDNSPLIDRWIVQPPVIQH